jgi:ribosome biogenesis GTPase A
MAIQWFPGHMTQARKKAEETMEVTDLVIEVLDARIPEASHNPMIEQLRLFRQRPNLKILNKTDLADPVATQAWLNHYNKQPGVKAVALSCKKPGEAGKIPALCRALAPHRGTHLKPLRMMIMGIPNVGKSTLMNALLNRRIAKVGDEPAVTKSQLGHDLGGNVWLVDTPGMLWPGVGQRVGLKLAATHSIGQNAYDPVEVAAHLASYLLAEYGELLRRRFPALSPGSNGHEILDAIARSRSLLLKGGLLDRERAARTLLGEFRAGTLGRISLETPDEIASATPRTDP